METKELADVTLISDDQKQLHAHKVFLSAGSEVFRNILINNTHKHPVIYLTNIQHQELTVYNASLEPTGLAIVSRRHEQC